jgi:hypothetical protein
MRTVLLSLVLLAPVFACSDYKFVKHKDPAEGGEDTAFVAEDTAEPDDPWTGACDEIDIPGSFQGFTDACPDAAVGSFTPIVEWDAGAGKACFSQPVVGDLDGDGSAEVAVVIGDIFAPITGSASLWLLDGTTGSVLWQRAAEIAYGSPPALGDVDGDGLGDIVAVKQITAGFLGSGTYAVVLYNHEGGLVWESAHFSGSDFDYATAPILSDMDHDGFTEIIVGRAILNHDGTTRGVGSLGRGSYGNGTEASVPAVADLDLDGIEEVIVGNAMYSPDGHPVWSDFTQSDGMVSVGNLDDDAFGEFVVSTNNTVRAMDTHGSVMWGPLTLPGANIVSTAAIGDVDGDGEAEIIVAGGNALWCLGPDGTLEWSAPVTDESGATGASLFDFEGDGIMEVVYIDEIEMIAFDGATGEVKFHSTEHASATMFDYPTIVDVDGDDQAEILVCHDGHSAALTAYGDRDESWATTRGVWNQHAYSITNINDDLSIPVDATPNFTLYNNYHAAIDRLGGDHLGDDVGIDIVDICEDECEGGRLLVTVQLVNLSERPLDEDVDIALYGAMDGDQVWLATLSPGLHLEPGWRSDSVTITVSTEDLVGVMGIIAVADDDGTGTGVLSECSELDNTDYEGGRYCE